MVDFAKLVGGVPGVQKYLDFQNVERSVAFIRNGSYPSSLTSGFTPGQWVEDLAKDAGSRAAASLEEGAAGYLVRDFGVTPPLSRAIMEKLNPVAQFPFAVKLEFSEEELTRVAKKLLDDSPFGGFPVAAQNGDPVILTASAAKWTLEAAKKIPELLNIPVPNEINTILNSGAIDFAMDIYKNLPPSAFQSWEAIRDGVANMAGVSASSTLGAIDWSKGAQIASMSVSALKDGIVSQEEAQQIGAAAGALAGAAIGSVIPGVGTVIGGAIGSLAGLFAGELGQKTAPPGIHEAFKARLAAAEKLAKEQSLAELQRRDAWVAECGVLYKAYFDTLESCIQLVARHWLDLETKIGWRFDIRWFDPNPGRLFIPTGTLVTKTVFDTKEVDGKRVAVGSHAENYVFCNKEYGCAYPAATASGKLASAFSPGFTATSPLDPSIRAASAMAARGFVYAPEGRIRMGTEEYTRCEYWGGMQMADFDKIAAQTGRYTFNPKTDLRILSSELARLNMATNLTILDLNRTAALVQAEKDMWASRAMAIAGGINLGAFGRAALLKSVATGAATSVTPDGTQTLKNTSNPNDPLVKAVVGAEAKQDMNKSLMLYLGAAAVGLGTYQFIRSRK